MGQHPAIIDLDIPGEGDLTYYVSGLSDGKWQVNAGKKSLTIKVKPEERFASFKAPAGKLTLIRK